MSSVLPVLTMTAGAALAGWGFGRRRPAAHSSTVHPSTAHPAGRPVLLLPLLRFVFDLAAGAVQLLFFACFALGPRQRPRS